MAEVRSVGRGEIGSLRVGFIGSAMLTQIPSGHARALSARSIPGPTCSCARPCRLRSCNRSSTARSMSGFLRDGGPLDGARGPRHSSPSHFVAVLPIWPFSKQGAKAISAAALREEPFVFFPQAAGRVWLSKGLIAVCEEHGFRPRIVQVAPQWLTLHCVLSGLAWASVSLPHAWNESQLPMRSACA